MRLGADLLELEAADRLNELADRVMLLERVAKGLLRIDPVPISATLFLATEHVSLLQVQDDALDCALRDTDIHRDIAQSHMRVVSNADEYMPVVTE